MSKDKQNKSDLTSGNKISSIDKRLDSILYVLEVTVENVAWQEAKLDAILVILNSITNKEASTIEEYQANYYQRHRMSAIQKHIISAIEAERANLKGDN